jgi:hypothetical protein
MRWLALALVALAAGCGSGHAAAPDATTTASGPPCTSVLSSLRRARTVADVTKATRLLRARYDVDATAVGQSYAAAVRLRVAVRRAIGDGRATTARRLMAQARLIVLRANELSADLCP